MKVGISAALWVAAMLAAPSAAEAREWQVKMLNLGNGLQNRFEPAFIAIKPGDTVRFLPVAKGHNAESSPGMSPAGAVPFKGKINQEIVVRFSRQGLYAYECVPHINMGMVGLIQVGRAGNKAQIAAEAERLPGLAKKAMADLLTKVR